MKSKTSSLGFLKATLATVSVVGIAFAGLSATPAQASAPADGEYSCQTGAPSLDANIPRYTVTGGAVFQGWDCIGIVEIAAGVTSIGESAFEEGLLETINIPPSVTTIGIWAFADSNLENITIPNSVVMIERSAFRGTSNLASIEIPNSVISIGDSAFRLSGLQSIHIPNSVISIGDSAFRGNASLVDGIESRVGLESITFQDRAPSSPPLLINFQAFRQTKLTSIVIPDSVTSIKDSTFRDAHFLETVTIPNSVTEIGEHAFSSTFSLQSITIPNSVETIWESAFRSSGIRSITFPDRAPNSTLSIRDRAFQQSALTSIVIPSGVTSIAYNTFLGAVSLASATIPDTVTSIGEGAFDSSGISSINIPNRVSSIGSFAFAYSQLESITFPGRAHNGPLSIGEGAFQGSALRSIAIPSGVTSIEDFTFSGAESLASVTIPNTVNSIGELAFGETGSLESISIPASVTVIGHGAFGASDLRSITFPDRAPNSPLSIGEGAFQGSDLRSIAIPSGVISIRQDTFKSATDLVSVSIPSSVTSIGASAFEGASSLESITIPATVDYIGEHAFAGASSLSSVYFLGNAPALNPVTEPTNYTNQNLNRGGAFVTEVLDILAGDFVTIESVDYQVSSIVEDDPSAGFRTVYAPGAEFEPEEQYSFSRELVVFEGLPAGARAFIQPTATGFRAPFGSAWRGLSLRQEPSSLYRDWQVPLPSISNGLVVGETAQATAFERVLRRDLHEPNGPEGDYFTDTVAFPTPEEYVYRITRTPNDESTSVDLQSSSGYEPLTATEQQYWYDYIMPPNTTYVFSWKAFLCVGAGEPSIPTDISVSYASREDGILPNSGGFNAAHDFMLRDAANEWIDLQARSTRTIVGTKMNDGSYTHSLLGSPDGRGYMSKAFAVLDVTSPCGSGKTLEAVTIVDADDNPITTKSFVIPSQLRLDVPGTNISVNPIGVTIGVTGAVAAAEFNAALWGLTTIADPNAPPPNTDNTPTTTQSQPALPPASLAATGANPITGGLVLGSAVTLATLGAFLLWKRRRLSN